MEASFVITQGLLVRISAYYCVLMRISAHQCAWVRIRERISPTFKASKTQKSSKINKFAKSPSSRAGIPIVGFLMTNSIIEDQNSTTISTIRIYTFADNMGPKWS